MMTLSPRVTRVLLAMIVLGVVIAGAWHAMGDPNRSRVWDERYSLRNVKSILLTGDLQPVFPYYTNLSHLPHTAVAAVSQWIFEATGNEAFEVVKQGAGLTPHGYRLARWTNTAFAAGALLLTFVLGRRVFNREVALLGVLLLSATPLFLLIAGIAKPEAPLLFFMLLAFLWGLDAAEDGSWRNYLLAGLGVGLAASTKQTGALVAVAPIVATLIGYRERSRWIRLVGAGATSIAVFLILHPFPSTLRRYLLTIRLYLRSWADKRVDGVEPADGVLGALTFLPQLLLKSKIHNALLGTLALVGFAALFVFLIRKLHGAQRVSLAMFLGFPVGFALITALVSSQHRGNVFIGILPFSSLAAAWLIYEAWGYLAARLPRASTILFWPMFLALLILTVVPAAAYVYATAVRQTALEVTGYLIVDHQPSWEQRRVVYESGVEKLKFRLRPSKSRLRPHSRRVESLREFPADALDAIDYEVFPAERLKGPDREFYVDRMARLRPDQVWQVDATLFKVRGPNQVVLAHPWNSISSPEVVAWQPPTESVPSTATGSLPQDPNPGAWVSMDVLYTRQQANHCDVLFGPHELDLHTYRPVPRRGPRRMSSRRFPLTNPSAPLVVQCAEKRLLEPPPTIEVSLWSPPAP